MTPMNDGERDRLIELQQRRVERDAALGSEVVTWPKLATVWAKVIESSSVPGANHSATAEAALYVRPMKVRILWRALDTSSTRISYGGRLLRITGSAEIGRRDGLELAVEEWAHE